MASDLRVPLDPIWDAFGVDATVTRPWPDNDPIETTVVWVLPLVMDALPTVADFQRSALRRVLALRRDEVAAVPRGTIITAPETRGGPVKTWVVDEIEHEDAEQTRAVVVPEG